MKRRSLFEPFAKSESEKPVPGDMVRISTPAITTIDNDLRAFTPARVALAHTGLSLTTKDTLAFAADHAQARDAVYATLSLPTLLAGLSARKLPVVAVKSAAPDRKTYLRRPDLGRTLSEASRTTLAVFAGGLPKVDDQQFTRLTIILADGLSALAIDRNALGVIDSLLPLIEADWEDTHFVIAEQARVALGDAIGVALHAAMTLMLIGERPGLAAADSLGAYITWAPAIGRTNAERNCISNVRSGGLGASEAAQRIAFYLREARRLQATGTALKEPDSLSSLLRASAS